MESHKSTMIRLFIFSLGLTAMATQVILIREALAVFHGNELIIGLFLGFWMLFTAIGSFLASRWGSRLPASLLLLLALLPLLSLFTLIFLRFTLIPAGVMAGLGQTSLLILMAIAPFCLVSGMLFPLLVRELSVLKDKNLLHEGYALDSAGSILGGLIISLVFIFIFSSFESLLVLAMVCLLLYVIWSWMTGYKVLAVSILIIAIIMLALALFLKPDRLLNRIRFSKQDTIEVRNSPFGKLAVTSMDGQLFIYENGVPVKMGDDAVYREESVHYAMLMHPKPKNVLLLSGGASGMIEEILKYPIDKADYIETNRWLFSLIGNYRAFPKDTRLNYIFRDPRILLGKSDKKYDVILLNTTEPNSAEMNRFYTVEFYSLLKERLNPDGIISMSVPAAGNYMNEISRQVHSVSYNTLKKVFCHIRIIPGNKDYFLASDSSLDHSFLQNYLHADFTNIYVNPFYINEDLQNMRSDLILKDILPDEPVNSDLRPYVFSLFLRHWLEQFKMNQWVMPLILILLLILSLIFLGPLNLGLFAGGFTASALEFLLLIWFQVMYGYVYQMTGVIFAVFMAGMATGSLFRQYLYKNKTFRGFINLQGIIAAFSALVALIMLLVPSGSANWLLFLLILCLVMITGLLTGIQFSLSAHLRKSNILKSSGESFSADLLGSAIGILLVSVYFVPQLGLPMTGMVLAGLNLLVCIHFIRMPSWQ